MTEGKPFHMHNHGGHQILAGMYEMKKTLGKGHYAVVKLADHIFTGEKVAIKVIDKTKLDKISAEHLYHEVKCMKLVKHPNVVRLYEVIDTKTKLYLILELGDGGDMYDYIMKHDQGLSEDKARDYFAQIVRAISYCHKLHVVHRDLKPENVVFFERQGIVKLTDFGFSNCYSPGQKLSTSCGSLAYSAPEILLGEEYDAPAVDVWSLGVILYMLVCGEAPFNEANDSETLTNIMDCRYTIFDHVSEECRDLIDKMIIRNPLERISLDEIQNHVWLQSENLEDVELNYLPLVTKERISVDMHIKITHEMIQGNMAKLAEIEQAVLEERYDHITSTYFLIAERLMRCDSAMDTDELDDVYSLTEPQKSDKILVKLSNTIKIPVPQKQDDVHGSFSSVASSPPCQQAQFMPHRHLKATSQDVAALEYIAEDSGSASSSSSSLPQRLSASPAHVLQREKKSSPSYPREHLTITPRHGFSVVKGGIDTLIEEEERSRSQTTTDDEDDGIITEHDDNCQINPHQLATHLQRATIQLPKQKRIKKRKSAPVLNEIFEENEGENDCTSSSNQVSDSALSTRHGRLASSSAVPQGCQRDVFTTRPQDYEVMGAAEDIVPELNIRQGRTSRRKSHKSSGSETSDDDSESRRTSRTNLSTVLLSSLNRIRRDSSGDRDQGGGSSGGDGQHPERKSNQKYSSSTDNKNNENYQSKNSGSNQDSENFKENKLSNDKFEGTLRPVNNNNSTHHRISDKNSGNNTQVLNNMLNRGRRVAKHKAPYSQITNVFEKRSKSAESSSTSSAKNIGGSQTSSARSSCSNLSIGNQKGRIFNSGKHRNSSSTMSDTGLVIRLNNLRRAGVQASLIPRSPSTSSFSSLFLYGGVNSLIYEEPTSCSQVGIEDQNFCIQMEKNNRLNLFARAPHIPVHPCIPESEEKSKWNNLQNVNRDENFKNSNLSLGSSLTSSKFAIDPVNELSHTQPCEIPEIYDINFTNTCSENKNSLYTVYSTSDESELISQQKIDNNPPRISRTFLSYLSVDNLCRKKTSVSTKDSESCRHEWAASNKALPGSISAIAQKDGIIRSCTSKSDGDLVIQKLKSDCCRIM